MSVRMKTGNSDIEFQNLNPIYHKNVEKVCESIKYEKSIIPKKGMVLITSSDQAGSLEVLVDSNHIISQASHQGCSSIPQKGVLDEFCRIITGLPLLEAADHGVILLEDQLRDHSFDRPVPGIVLPKNADPIFKLPLLLIREVLSQHRKATKFDSNINFYLHESSTEWTQLSNNDRFDKLNKFLVEFCERFPFQTKDIEFVKISKNGKVIMTMNENIDRKEKPRYILQLEMAIQEKIEPTLRLYLQEKKDDSTLRRL